MGVVKKYESSPKEWVKTSGVKGSRIPGGKWSQSVEKLFFIPSYTYCCHSRENGNPAFLICYWMPAFASMTFFFKRKVFQHPEVLKHYKELKVLQKSYQWCLEIYKITKRFS